MRILLTGATGFIGRHVGELAAAEGIEVVAASRSAGLDLRSARVTARWVREVAPDAVVNCAGVTHGPPDALVAGNVVAVAHLVAAVAGRGVRLVHLGSAAEYGNTPAGKPVTEDTAPAPAGAYGITKLGGTELIRAAVAEGTDAVALRVFNPVGPGSPASSLAGRLARELAGDGGDVRVGSLDAHRDLVDVRDVAAAIVAAARAPGPLPPVLNVGSGRATRLRELVDSLVLISGADRRVVEAPGGPDGIPWSQADLSAVRGALGWEPLIDLGTSLRDLWEDRVCLT
ncbi:NAD-dependent epimerase/dehydratase family protein [Actinomadura scrupuli]|uniref:NAD-dependent epimerase/dehydratase family protein n=1 Tax=Actinomadura scrupuli TaxID=559629 RepID=UPI003D9844C7